MDFCFFTAQLLDKILLCHNNPCPLHWSNEDRMFVALYPLIPIPTLLSLIGEFVIGRVIKAMNNNWHAECFRCELCTAVLADTGFIKNRGR